MVVVGWVIGGGETPGKEKQSAERAIPEMPLADPTGERRGMWPLREAHNIEKREMGALSMAGWRTPPCSSWDIA